MSYTGLQEPIIYRFFDLSNGDNGTRRQGDKMTK